MNNERKQVCEITDSAPTGFEGAVALVVLLLVTGGSVTPFDFAFDSSNLMMKFGNIGWPAFNLPDAGTNFVVYLILGAVLFLWLSIHLPRSASLILSMLCASGLSFLVELVQTISPARFASWYDVIADAIGAFAGVLIACFLGSSLRRACRGFRLKFDQSPMNSLYRLTMIAVFACALVPFDFMATVSKLHNLLYDTNFSLLPVVQSDGFNHVNVLTSVFSLPQEHDLLLASAFVVLGSMCALSGWEKGNTIRVSIFTGLTLCWIFAFIVELLQSFSLYHSFGLDDLLRNGLGASVGVFVTVVAIRDRLTVPTGNGVLRIPFRLIFALWTLHVAALLTSKIEVCKTIICNNGFTCINWIPFADYFHRPFLSSTATMVELMAAQSLLAILTLALLLKIQVSGWLSNLYRVSAVLAATCCIATGAVSSSGVFSVSNVILAVFSWIASYHACRLLMRRDYSSNRAFTKIPDQTDFTGCRPLKPAGI